MSSKKDLVISLKDSGLSIRDISKQTDVPTSTVARWLREAEEIISTHCPVCGKEVFYTRGHRPKKFCSDRCCLIWWRRHHKSITAIHTLTCEHCGKPFKAAKKYQRFCSRQCYLDEVCGHE